jgi:hypothetical protein
MLMRAATCLVLELGADMRRCDFIALLGSVALACPHIAKVQEPDPKPGTGILVTPAEIVGEVEVKRRILSM